MPKYCYRVVFSGKSPALQYRLLRRTGFSGDLQCHRYSDRRFGSLPMMLEDLRSDQSMSAPRRGRADLFRSAVFEKTNSLRGKTSVRGLHGADISDQEALLAKNKHHLRLPMTPSSAGKRHRVYSPHMGEGQEFDSWLEHS
ncbi:hypothetical protein LXL04_009989 [Taraxacum kok-saghyz]